MVALVNNSTSLPVRKLVYQPQQSCPLLTTRAQFVSLRRPDEHSSRPDQHGCNNIESSNEALPHQHMEVLLEGVDGTSRSRAAGMLGVCGEEAAFLSEVGEHAA